MGIERFFNSLRTNETIRLKDSIMLSLREKLQGEYVYIDFNSIIHNIAKLIETELNYLLYEIIYEDGEEIDLKAKEIAEKYKFNLINLSVDTFKTYFTHQTIDVISMEFIQESVMHIISNLVDPTNIKTVFISMDGIPTMSKVNEQKKRRYATHIISSLKNKVYDNYKESLSEKRVIFEDARVHYDRGRIVPWTHFIRSVVDKIKEMSSRVYDLCPKLQRYIISSPDNPGEGEKKIMEDVIKTGAIGKYIVFSPDADMIILSMIMQNRLESMKKKVSFEVLRFDQQTESYDSISIDTLRKNLYEYVLDKVNKPVTVVSVTDDITFLFSLFGNDFIPRIESINVNNDFETIIKAYYDNVNKSVEGKHTLVFNDRGVYKISFYNFFNVIKNIARQEDDMLHETYMANNYKNYNYLKKIFGNGRLYNNLQNYINNANDVIEALRECNEHEDYDVTNIVRRYKSNEEFMKQFLAIEWNLHGGDYDNLDEAFKDVLSQKVRMERIKGMLRFHPYEMTVGDSCYHQQKIQEGMFHPMMEVTQYDNQLYKLDHHMEEYEVILNATNHHIGRVTLEVGRKYVMRTDSYMKRRNLDCSVGNIRENLLNYYREFFDLDVRTDEGSTRLRDVVYNYIEGLFWVFDFYFNKNDPNINYNKVSTWFYRYHRAPLLTDIYCVMYARILERTRQEPQNDRFVSTMNKLFGTVADINNRMSYVDRERYMNKLEHTIYILPLDKQNDIPEEYVTTYKGHPELFTSMSTIINSIWNHQGTQYIDCRGIHYLNKCTLHIPTVDFYQFMRIFGPLRSETIRYTASHPTPLVL